MECQGGLVRALITAMGSYMASRGSSLLKKSRGHSEGPDQMRSPYLGLYRDLGMHRVQDLGLRVQGLGFGVQGSGFGV